MKCTASQAVSAMAYWVGYYEKSSAQYVKRRDKAVFALDKGSNNYTYAGHLCGINGYYAAWCAMQVTTALTEACGNKTDAKALMYGVWPYSRCDQLYDAAPSSRKGRRSSWKPAAGDIIVFSSNGSTRQHTGMVEGVDSTYVYTIEGNVSNMCKRKKYKRTDSYIWGYVRPDYSAGVKDTVTMELPILRYGMESETVRSLQYILIGKKYDLGKDGADGEFGSKTSRAVSDFQQANGLEVDGQVGEETWHKLLFG